MDTINPSASCNQLQDQPNFQINRFLSLSDVFLQPNFQNSNRLADCFCCRLQSNFQISPPDQQFLAHFHTSYHTPPLLCQFHSFRIPSPLFLNLNYHHWKIKKESLHLMSSSGMLYRPRSAGVPYSQPAKLWVRLTSMGENWCSIILGSIAINWSQILGIFYYYFSYYGLGQRLELFMSSLELKFFPICFWAVTTFQAISIDLWDICSKLCVLRYIGPLLQVAYPHVPSYYLPNWSQWNVRS